MKLESIPHSSLYPAKHHHRTNWGDMDALRRSIAAVGLISPVVVRPGLDGGFEIVAGVRRWQASDPFTRITCIVSDVDELTAILMQAEENLKRADLHPIDEAMYCAELSTRGIKPDEIASKLGITRRRVTRRMGLLALNAHAREAFATGLFDEDAALAIARVDSGRQDSVLDALSAGALQPEEITSYVNRHHSANLSDVPWRVSDAELVRAAGACTTCHKRSDVQRDLFPETTTGLRCLDTLCYRAKMDAVYILEAHRAKDVEVVMERADELFIPSTSTRPTVLNSSGMVDADAPCKLLENSTWREAVTLALADTGKRVPLLLARDQDGRPRYLMREAEAAKIVRGSDAAIEAREAEAAADPVLRDEIKAAKKRRQIALSALAAVVATGDNDTWAWVVERMVADAAPRVAALAAEALKPAIALVTSAEGKAGLLALAQSSNRGARRVATVLMVLDGVTEPDALEALAVSCGTTMAKLEGAS